MEKYGTNKNIKSEEYEANSRIIQRLASVGVIDVVNLDENKLESLFDLVGFGDKFIDQNGKDVVEVKIMQPTTSDEANDLALYIGNQVLNKIALVPFDKIANARVIVKFESI